MLLKKFK
jgi:hypothetical protein